jgi:hypothetical protein
MENTLLQSLLQSGLLDIGDSDERLKNIEESIADIQAKLGKDLSLLPSYTLVALDPNIPSDDQVLIDTETIVSTHWKALRAKFSERPIPILRAVILNALYNLGTANPLIARIIYLTATNFYPYAKLGRDKIIIEKIISELGDLAEKNAADEWSLVDTNLNLKIGVLKVEGLKFDEVVIDDSDLKNKLKIAAARTPQNFDPFNHPAQWSQHFSDNAAAGVVSILNSAFQNFSKSLSPTTIETPINKFFAEFKKSLDQVLKTSFNSISAVERRSKLLWWKETLYSSSLKNSYRTIDKSLQPIIMSFDLYNQLPKITPVSVDFLLKDTLLILNNTADKKITFGELFQQITKVNNKELLKDYFEDNDLVEGRISITDFIALVIHDKADISSFKQRTGIGEKEMVALTDIAVFILHDMMTFYLISK